MVIALAAFGQPILKLWLGVVPPQTYKIMIALGLVTAIQLPGHQCFIFLTGIGRNQILIRLSLIGAAVNLAGSIAATYLFGPVGPAIGSLPVVVVIDFFVLPVMVCRVLGMPFGRYARQALLPVVPGGLVAGLIAAIFLLAHPLHGGRPCTTVWWPSCRPSSSCLPPWPPSWPCCSGSNPSSATRWWPACAASATDAASGRAG